MHIQQGFVFIYSFIFLQFFLVHFVVWGWIYKNCLTKFSVWLEVGSTYWNVWQEHIYVWRQLHSSWDPHIWTSTDFLLKWIPSVIDLKIDILSCWMNRVIKFDFGIESTYSQRVPKNYFLNQDHVKIPSFYKILFPFFIDGILFLWMRKLKPS